ncbi:hypothetical protein [Sandarakinorhabdus limnophila]|uniref:hypothetical protein n=1 Tax=Sandarakinorhabdus limnophila TaxID=210512 RepID=UPI0031378FBC
MALLDTQVIEGLKQKLFTTERMGKLLSGLLQRNAARDATVVERRRTTEAERNEVKTKLDRLYHAIENGVIELDDDTKGRIGETLLSIAGADHAKHWRCPCVGRRANREVLRPDAAQARLRRRQNPEGLSHLGHRPH